MIHLLMKYKSVLIWLECVIKIKKKKKNIHKINYSQSNTQTKKQYYF